MNTTIEPTEFPDPYPHLDRADKVTTSITISAAEHSFLYSL